MKTLYLDCQMGAAGDMLSAALYELLDDKEAFLKKLGEAGIDHVSVKPEPSVKCGILGTHMSVLVDGMSEEEIHDHHHEHEHHHDHEHEDHEHHHHDHEHEGHEHHHVHTSMKDINDIVDGLKVSSKVKEDVKSVYALIAEAESNAHGVPVTDIHFHEVGTMDAVCDITMFCMLIEELKPDEVLSSEVHVGSGHVHCAHGTLPVPAPATAYILKGIPMYQGHIRGELCTPTGAALLKHFVRSFGSMPVMTVSKIGYGMGKKDFDQANCVRAFWGSTGEDKETVIELSCNIDDMTPEKIAFATEKFFEEGALDVYTVPVGMKKGRPGILLCVMCGMEDKDKMISLIFEHTTTLGLRENISRRFTLKREVITKETPFGTVHVKRSEGYGVIKEKIEYEDLARIAREKDISIVEVERGLL